MEKERRIPIVTKADLATFAGNSRWDKILEIDIQLSEIKGKTLLFPEKASYDILDLELTGIGIGQSDIRKNNALKAESEAFKNWDCTRKEWRIEKDHFVKLITTIAKETKENVLFPQLPEKEAAEHTKRLPPTTNRLAALADKGGLDGEVLEIETPKRTILYPRKGAYGIYDIVLAAGTGTKYARVRTLEIVNRSRPNPRQEVPASFTPSAFVYLVKELTRPIIRREKRQLRQDVQFILPDGKTITIPTLYPQVLQKLIDGQRQGERITHTDFPKLNINTFHAIISDFRQFLVPYGFKIETFRIGELKQEGKCEYGLEKAEGAPLKSLKTGVLANEKSSSDGPHDPVLLGARLSKEQPTFSKLEEIRKNLEEEITKSLSKILDEGKRKKVCFLIDVYDFIEPLLSQNNLTLTLFVDRWFSKDEEDEEKAKVNREKVKEKILASFESGLINRYKIYGTLFWEEAKKEIASLKLEASNLLF